MKLINTNNILSFLPEGNETETELAFLERIKQYSVKANGATILIYNQNNRLMTCINPFDNTQFICADDGYTLASDFGAKRFLAGEAHKQIKDEKAKEVNAIHYSRDLSFPIKKRMNDVTLNYNLLDLAGMLNQFRSDKDKLYDVLSELFNRCADFTPGKQDEYLVGGKKEDKYCRFNLANNMDKQVASTEQFFLTDDKNNITGTVSATVIKSNDGSLDIYFYDEIVDYFTLLNAKEIEELYAKSQQLRDEKATDVKSRLEKEIAAIVEPKRAILMAQLFSAARQGLRNSMSDLDEKIEKGLVYAFIRAAAGRVDAYVELGCSKTNTENFVIHGQATAQLKMLDNYIKTWAAEQLKALQPKPSSISLTACYFQPPAILNSSAVEVPKIIVNPEIRNFAHKC